LKLVFTVFALWIILLGVHWMMGQCLSKSNELYTMWYKYHLKAKLEANADLKEEKEEMFNTG